jgi:hypothetical protein
MVTKGIIGFLCFCLVVVVGLFLYTNYSSNDSVSPSSPSLSENSGLLPQTSASADEMSASVQADKQVEEQPDKTLPIPAHQLKKIIAELKADRKIDENAQLKEKINAANQAIATINKQLPESPSLSSPPANNDNVPQGAELQQSQESQQEPQKNSQDRIEHMRDHLNK